MFGNFMCTTSISLMNEIIRSKVTKINELTDGNMAKG